MRQRQIVLDTETTGLHVAEGHRIIEIGCVELIDRKLTGKTLHYYINPDRKVEAGALAVHGITDEFLRDKPRFNSLAPTILNFISGAELIIHNAPFDVGFLNSEFATVNAGWTSLDTHCDIFDTLTFARQRHAGQKNSLDILCKRYGIDNTKRQLHGALLDAHLLAQVYLAMTGGQGTLFETESSHAIHQQQSQKTVNYLQQRYVTPILHATTDELIEHDAYLAFLRKQGGCIWT